MPGTTITEEIEVVSTTDSGGGGGNGPGGFGGNGDGEGGFESSSRIPQRAYMTGMTVALAGILMFFMALVSAYIVRKGLSNDWRPLDLPRILWLNTLLLLASSATLMRARSAFQRQDQASFRHWWYVTTALGLMFVAGQLTAWRQLARAGIYLPTNPSSSFFYVFTAAHAVHLLGGILALLFVALRPTRRLARGTATEVVSLYWHFMDGLWVFLFTLLILAR